MGLIKEITETLVEETFSTENGLSGYLRSFRSGNDVSFWCEIDYITRERKPIYGEKREQLEKEYEELLKREKEDIDHIIQKNVMLFRQLKNQAKAELTQYNPQK